MFVRHEFHGCVMLMLVFAGCCPNDPLAALTAGRTLMERVDPDAPSAEQTYSFAQTLASLSPCELASLVNFVRPAGDWTEEKAETVQEVFAQVDELKAQQLSLLGPTDGEATAEDIQRGFTAVGILISLDTAGLIKELIDSFAEFRQGGAPSGWLPVLPVPLPAPLPL